MRTSAIVGLIGVLFGLAVIVQRGIAGLLDLDYVIVTLIGVLAIVQGIKYANEARKATFRYRETPDVESRESMPAPGDDIDDLIGDLRGLSRIRIERRREFHTRLIRVAKTTLLARGDYGSEGEAETAIADGTWTDDPVAAWFLGEQTSPPPIVRLRGLLGRDAEFQYASHRTIDAIAAAQDGAGRGTGPETRRPGTAAGSTSGGSDGKTRRTEESQPVDRQAETAGVGQ